MHDEERLKEKLRAIEALFAGATTPGERDAAEHARQRITARLAQSAASQKEWQFSLDPWGLRLLIALARRYGLKPYRYRRQRKGTLVVRAEEQFMRNTFFPEFEQMSKTLYAHLTAVTERVVAEALNADRGEPAVVDAAPQQLEAFAMGPKVAGE